MLQPTKQTKSDKKKICKKNLFSCCLDKTFYLIVTLKISCFSEVASCRWIVVSLFVFLSISILLFFTDISIAAVDLMQELTDVDTLNESEEGAAALIGALVCVSSSSRHFSLFPVL